MFSQNKDTNIFSCLPPDSLSPTRLTACPQVPASSEFSRTYSASNSSVGRKSRYALITHHLLLHPSGHLLVGRVSMVHTSQRNCYLEPDSRSNANPSIRSITFHCRDFQLHLQYSRDPGQWTFLSVLAQQRRDTNVVLAGLGYSHNDLTIISQKKSKNPMIS